MTFIDDNEGSGLHHGPNGLISDPEMHLAGIYKKAQGLGQDIPNKTQVLASSPGLSQVVASSLSSALGVSISSATSGDDLGIHTAAGSRRTTKGHPARIKQFFVLQRHTLRATSNSCGSHRPVARAERLLPPTLTSNRAPCGSKAHCEESAAWRCGPASA